MAWPPKRSIRSGCRLVTRSSASRRCRPGIERPEPLSSPVVASGKGDGGRWNFSLMRPARMPITPWCHSGSNSTRLARLPGSMGQPGHGAFFLHAGLDAAAFAVELVELWAMLMARAHVVGDQAFDAQRHVGQAAGGVEARAEGEAQVEGGGPGGVAAGGGKQGADAGLHAVGAHALQALGDEDAVVAVERTTSATVPSATRSSRSARLGSACLRRRRASRSSARSASMV
jgi:hypothetical protein